MEVRWLRLQPPPPIRERCPAATCGPMRRRREAAAAPSNQGSADLTPPGPRARHQVATGQDRVGAMEPEHRDTARPQLATGHDGAIAPIAMEPRHRDAAPELQSHPRPHSTALPKHTCTQFKKRFTDPSVLLPILQQL